MLLDREPALLNTQEEDGQTALHYAAFNGHSDLVKLLIDRGADSSIVDNDGNTACNEETDPVIAQLFRLKLD